MTKDHSRLKQEIIKLIKSMVFLCMYCNNQNPMTASVVDFEYSATGAYATAFLFVLIVGINSL
jgi:hypothetical protein